MKIKDIEAAVRSRHSVREYTDRPIEASKLDTLSRAIEEANLAGNVNMRLVVDEPMAFGASRLARYGHFSGVRYYVAVVAPASDAGALAAGYWGEEIVLLAQSLGLRSCWVGLSYSRRRVPVTVGRGERLYALIALGYGATDGVAHRSKEPSRVANAEGLAQPWFARAVEFALLAPTALNQQKFRFELLPDGSVRASRSWGPYTRLDLGIACRHFELGAEPQQVVWAH